MPKNKKPTEDITCDIVTVYGWLADNKIFCRVSWNGNEPKDEIRYVKKNADGSIRRLGAGIAVLDDEKDALIDAVKKSRGVDFDAIFDSSVPIMEARKKGYTTRDGEIITIRRKSENG